MIVSGLLVNIVADKLEQVKTELLKIKEIEIDSILDDHKIMVTVELKSVKDQVKISSRIMNIDGVLEVNIAYHHFSDDGQS